MATILDNWGAHLPPLEELAVEHPDRFSHYRNGYNNTHEAIQCLRLAAMHLVCARLNGEDKDEFRTALESFGVIDTLIEDICKTEKFDKTFSDRGVQMQKRFDRVWKIKHN